MVKVSIDWHGNVLNADLPALPRQGDRIDLVPEVHADFRMIVDRVVHEIPVDGSVDKWGSISQDGEASITVFVSMEMQ